MISRHLIIILYQDVKLTCIALLFSYIKNLQSQYPDDSYQAVMHTV